AEPEPIEIESIPFILLDEVPLPFLTIFTVSVVTSAAIAEQFPIMAKNKKKYTLTHKFFHKRYSFNLFQI
ncbi:hypothetical protein, partial [uncultured Escherichia sp.]|uniref:hypothetical protein n=1 Tax=uncultured Escherichia sp. TaxID=237777 RepID=UPI0027295769